MKDERTCTMRREVSVRSTKECVTTDVTQSDLSLHFPQISRTRLYDIVSSHLRYQRPHSMRSVYKNLFLTTLSASIMVANMWKNSLKNVESDNNKILYENLLDLFLQQNGTYFLNKSRSIRVARRCRHLWHRNVMCDFLAKST